MPRTAPPRRRTAVPTRSRCRPGARRRSPPRRRQDTARRPSRRPRRGARRGRRPPTSRSCGRDAAMPPVLAAAVRPCGHPRTVPVDGPRRHTVATMSTGAPEEHVSSRVLTLPNVLSALRLLGVPVFLWALLDERDALAIVLLMASGITDYLDGKIARHYGQVSRVGQLLDPVADRLYIVTTLLGLAWRDILPWWLVGI